MVYSLATEAKKARETAQRETIEHKMIYKGATKQQAQSKAVDILLDVLAEDSGLVEKYLSNYRLQLALAVNALEKTRNEYADKLSDIPSREYAVSVKEKDLSAKETELKNLSAELKEMETPNARDAVRLMALFRESVKVDTRYDNTAFINGLAACIKSVGGGSDD